MSFSLAAAPALSPARTACESGELAAALAEHAPLQSARRMERGASIGHHRRVSPEIRRRLSGWIVSLALVAGVSGVIALLDPHTPTASLVVLYLLAILPVAVYWGALFGAVVSVLSTAAFDFWFVSPRNSFTPGDSGAWLDLAVFLVAAVVVSQLAGRSRRQALASARLAEEQAALRRVATLVAQAVPPSEIFETVTREIGQLSGADFARLERYEDDGTVTGVAAWSREDDPRLAVGTRFVLSGVSIAARVRETSRAVRVDSFTGAAGPIAEEARATGIRSSVGSPIWVGGQLWGVVAASSKREAAFPTDMESQMGEFTELVATAVANAVSRGQLAASRARVVAAADETRRRIERNLHDGIQQRLVTLGLELHGVRDAVPPDRPDLLAQISHIEDNVRALTDELREISRGIHPAILSQGGLGPALNSLARRSAVPVRLNVGMSERLPQEVEAAAYYAVSEALTNAAKHANASVAHVELAVNDGTLQVSIRDDGVGGADTARGSGIVGLVDRIEALGGTIAIASPPGGGTSIALELPLQSAEGRENRLAEAGSRTERGV
jgi:signal transduction histidine kinase